LLQRLVSRIKSIRSISEYVQLLRIFYGFYQPLETRLDPFFTETTFPGYEKRRKSGSLLRDIGALTQSSFHLELPEHIPDIVSFSSAMGALYVLEGSTLGGQVIAGMIEQQISPPSPMDFFFLRCYGSNTALMWTNFTQYLDRLSDTKEHQQNMIRSFAAACRSTRSIGYNRMA
jgi:heme oxygenase